LINPLFRFAYLIFADTREIAEEYASNTIFPLLIELFLSFLILREKKD
jgi:hypothetical protein